MRLYNGSTQPPRLPSHVQGHAVLTADRLSSSHVTHSINMRPPSRSQTRAGPSLKSTPYWAEEDTAIRFATSWCISPFWLGCLRLLWAVYAFSVLFVTIGIEVANHVSIAAGLQFGASSFPCPPSGLKTDIVFCSCMGLHLLALVLELELEAARYFSVLSCAWYQSLWRCTSRSIIPHRSVNVDDHTHRYS